MNNQKKNIRFNDPYAKQAFVDKQARDLVDKFRAIGAKFYKYRYIPFMVVNGIIVDLSSCEDVRAAIRWDLKIFKMSYWRETAISLRYQSEHLCQEIPEYTIGTVNAIEEPSRTNARRLDAKTLKWLQTAVDIGKLI